VLGVEVLGELPEFEVEVPWAPEVESVVATVRERFGAEITVLRLLTPLPDCYPGDRSRTSRSCSVPRRPRWCRARPSWLSKT